MAKRKSQEVESEVTTKVESLEEIFLKEMGQTRFDLVMNRKPVDLKKLISRLLIEWAQGRVTL